ncbi:MAG: ATP-binding protein [Ignavibacteria bacterium]|nr:ATP-binding protein [Ignavibacteria bacterium]
MSFDVILFLSFITISTLVSLAVVIFLLSKEKAPGTIYLAFAEMACLVWNIGYFIEIAGSSLAVKMIGVKIQYFFAMPFAPIFWYASARHFSSLKKAPRALEFILLAIIPTFTVILALTTELHSFFYVSPHLITSGNFLLIEKGWGIGFIIHMAYSYIAIFVAAIIMLQSLRKQQLIFKKQAAFLLSGIFLPWITSLIYVFGMSSFMRLDFTNASFTLSAAMIAWGMYKHGLFDLIPQAKEKVIEALRVSIIVIDQSNRVVDFNSSARLIFDNSIQIAQNLIDLFSLKGIKIAPFLHHDVKAEELSIDDRYYEISVTPVHDNADKINGSILTLYDVTHQKNIEKELVELNKTKDKFFSIIAHDLRNPFSSLIGLSDLLRTDKELYSEEERNEILLRIQEVSQNTFKLLENLLNWSKSQLGSYHIQAEIHSLRALITEAILQVQISAEQKNISIVHDEMSDVSCYVDANMIITAIRNLLSNAVKFTRKGGKITISLFEGPTPQIVISDNGIGMNKEQVNKLFTLEKLSETGTAGEIGSGLGLIIVKEFIEKHRGKITVESTPDVGTTFTISLPSDFRAVAD